MGLIFLLIILLLISIGILVIGCFLDNDCCACIGGLFTGLLGVAFVSGVITAIITQSCGDAEYQNMLVYKQELEHRLEYQQNYMIVDNELYEKIREFNRTITETKMFKDNWFIGIFYVEKIATIEYIDMGGTK